MGIFSLWTEFEIVWNVQRIKEVEKQLSKKIRTLRSHRAGVYLSQEFDLKYCWILSLQIPYKTP